MRQETELVYDFIPYWNKVVFELKIDSDSLSLRHNYDVVKGCFDCIFKQQGLSGLKNIDTEFIRDGQILKWKAINGTIFENSILVKVFKNYSIDLDIESKKIDDTLTVYDWNTLMKRHNITTSIKL